MELTTYTVHYRQGVDGVNQRERVNAYRVEGWREDYAFFCNPQNLSGPSVLIPRDLVLRVSEALRDESNVNGNANGQGLKAEVGRRYNVAYNGGTEGPYLSREQAEERGAELGQQGLVWALGPAD